MSTPPPTTFHTLPLPSSPNTSIAYLSAGAPTSPPLLLLHGYPSSSNQFRHLIPLLSPAYHVIAPDLPGFGLTTYPKDYDFTFANLTETVAKFVDAVGLKEYAVYIFDYGAPVALRLALKDPARIKAIVSQNGNAYAEGLGKDFWAPIQAIWTSHNSTEAREFVRGAMTLESVRHQYTVGLPASDLPLVDPVAYHYDYWQNMAGRENQDRQLDLIYDYRTNVELYPAFQRYFRESQVPLLAVWGKGDKIFVPEGAEAFKRDLKDARVEFVDAGHFVLETKAGEVAEKVRGFLKEVGYGA